MATASLSGISTKINNSLNLDDGNSNGTTLQILINNFLTTVTEANYILMFNLLQSASYSNILGNGNDVWSNTRQDIRTLITVADGTVAYDSSKTNNSFANFKSKVINENHNSRPEIMLSLLSNSGSGSANRYSTSVSKVDMNVVIRFGLSTTYPLGFYRLSQSLV